MTEAFRIKVGEVALSTTANTLNTPAGTNAVHMVCRIYNANAATQTLTLAGSVAGTITLPGNGAILFLDKLNTDTIASAANGTGLVAAIVGYSY